MAKDLITSTILEGERDASGYVHDGVEDHPGTAILTSGYDYDSDLYNDLVGWWPLAWGNARDLSGNGNHGTISGATTGVAGRGGLRAFSFDGNDDYVDPPNSGTPDSGEQCAFTAWVYPTAHDSFNTISRSWTSNHILRLDSGQIEFFLEDSGGGNHSVVGSTVPLNEWTHVVATYDSSVGMQVWLDGSLDVSNTDSFTRNTTDNDFRIGNDSQSSGRTWEGLIADYRTYSTHLTDTEIQTLYEWGSVDLAKPADQDDNGVSYYNFNSANANDQWGSNDGTVNGATHQASGGPREDGAYSFDGTDDSIISSSTVDPHNTGGVTLSCWVKGDGFDTNDTQNFLGIDEDSNNFYYIINRNGNWGIFTQVGGSNAIETAGSVYDDIWVHTVMTLDQSSHQLYMNGVKEIDESHSLDPSSIGAGSIVVGVRDSGGDSGNDPPCSMDEVRIYDRALSPAEIQELYRYGTFGIDMTQKVVNY